MFSTLYNEARRALTDRRPDEALRILATISRDLPGTWSTLDCLEAECLSAQGFSRRAVEVLQRAIARNTDDYWVFYNLAVQYRILGELENAAGAMRQLHRLLGWHESLAHGYTFSHDYFSGNIESWTVWFADYITAAPITCLEIGSWQGGSGTWLLDKVVGPRGGSLTCVDTFEGSSEHVALLPGLGPGFAVTSTPFANCRLDQAASAGRSRLMPWRQFGTTGEALHVAM
jgi:hypothetical protein